MFKRKNDLIGGPVLSELIFFSFPLFLSYLFQHLYNTVDTVIVGNHLGEMALAAVGASMAVYQLLLGFSFGFSGGFNVVIARAFGSGDTDLLKRNVAASMIISGIITVIVMVIGVFFLRPLLVLLKTPKEILSLTYDYIFIIIMFTGVSFLYNLTSGYLRSIGNSMASLIILIISSILNIGLDLLFVIVLDQGIQGAAVATVIAQTLAGVLSVVYIWSREHELIPKWHHFKFDKGIYLELLGQGLSMAMMFSLVILGTVVLQYSINQMGYLIIAGHTAARRLISILMMPMSSLSLAISTFVSQNKGANQRKRILQSVRYANIISVGYSIGMSLLVLVFAKSMMRLVSGSNQDELIINGANYLKFNTPFFTVVGVLFVMRYSLQGLGEKIKPLVSSIIELLMKFVFVLWIIPSLGYVGVIISEPIIWVVMTIQLCYAFYTHPYIRSEGVSNQLL